MITPQIGNQLSVASEASTELEKLQDASKKIEAIFIKDLLAQMQKNAPKGAFGKSSGSGIYQDMMNQAIADSASQSGTFGIASSIDRQLRKDIIGAAAAKVKLAAPAKGNAAQANLDVNG